MIGTQLNFRAISGLGACSTDRMNCCRVILSSHCYSSKIQFLSDGFIKCGKSGCVCGSDSGRFKTISCKSSFGSFSRESGDSADESCDDGQEDYVEAVLLVAEIISHHRMLVRGFKEETKWQSTYSLPSGPFSFETKDPRSQVHSTGSGFLRGFQNPTIFLKISCGGDFVLPIIVGESAIEKLIDSFHEDDSGDCPNQFQFMRNMIEEFGYEIKMVRITERVVDTYVSRIYFNKPGDKITFSVDAHPSDSINVAKRCKAPIYVNKQIVLADATRISYGLGRMSNKTVYDVSLDSAADGPDLLSEELNMIRDMNLAAKEERYRDAAMWKDKLKKLHETK